MENLNNQRKQLEQHLIEKAMKDESFRNKLLESPENAIEQEFKIKLPESIKIRVLQEQSNSFFLILPALSSDPVKEALTESELTSVAGGADGYSFAGCTETYAIFCH
jgi:hypothetical protein